MKKNDSILLISIFLYSFLFYKQLAGLNFFIFNIGIVLMLLYRNKELIKNKVWLSVASGTLISSFFVYYYDSSLAITANLFSLAILSAISINPKTSFITSIFLSLCAMGSSMVFIFLDWIERKSKPLIEKYSRPFYVKFLLFLIPFLIAVLFFFFYQTSNPLFKDLTKDINIDFISIAWIFFTLSGLLIMYGFYYNRIMKGISDIDSNASIRLTPEIASRKNFLNGMMRNDTECISGIILFSLLNALLLIVNVLDLHYLWLDGTLPNGVDHKGFVHDGIGTLITSIIVAIIIILFYFRGELNFYKNNKWIKIMAYFWILQNAFMIFSTAFRNDMYIEESGLSYKKIGVYVYLILVLIGLVSTFIKIMKVKTNWYLFRVNASVYYYFLVIACLPNWDSIITDFNIKKHDVEHKELEKYLLVDLSFKNLPNLLALADSVSSNDDFKARDYYYELRGTYFQSFKGALHRKLYDFMNEMKSLEWQSSCIEKTRVYNDIVKMKGNIHDIQIHGYYIRTLKPLILFDKLDTLNLQESYMNDLNELKMFPLLAKLNLSSNSLDTLNKLPALQHLKELDLSNNNIQNIEILRKIPNLEKLYLLGNRHISDFSPLLTLKHLNYLSIDNITRDGFDSLQHIFPNVKIQAIITN